MSLDLDYDEGQLAVLDAVAQFCADHPQPAAPMPGALGLPRQAWRELGELGVLSAGSEAGEGGVLEIAASMEALGAAAFPGPLLGCFLAQRVLPAPEAERVGSGEWIASVGIPPLLPWAHQADVLLEIAGEEVFRIEAVGELKSISSLAGDAWGRGEFRRLERLEGGRDALSLADVARAAYLAAAGLRMVANAADYARSRKQFGRAIGEFQAISHPLANCQLRLEAARGLARAAAAFFDVGEIAQARLCSARARLSATRAALEALEVGHQVFGAIGITLEGPAFQFSRRIRAVASEPPSEALARNDLLEEMGLEIQKSSPGFSIGVEN